MSTKLMKDPGRTLPRPTAAEPLQEQSEGKDNLLRRFDSCISKNRIQVH